MKISLIALLTVMFMPVALHACDCGCTCQPLFHFKDGITPNGPVTAVAIYGDPELYKCGTFGFRDYGAAHVVVAPPPVDTKEMKQPSS